MVLKGCKSSHKPRNPDSGTLSLAKNQKGIRNRGILPSKGQVEKQSKNVCTASKAKRLQCNSRNQEVFFTLVEGGVSFFSTFVICVTVVLLDVVVGGSLHLLLFLLPSSFPWWMFLYILLRYIFGEQSSLSYIYWVYDDSHVLHRSKVKLKCYNIGDVGNAGLGHGQVKLMPRAVL